MERGLVDLFQRITTDLDSTKHQPHDPEDNATLRTAPTVATLMASGYDQVCAWTWVEV